MAKAACSLIGGSRTSQGLAMAVNLTAKRLSPRASTINLSSSTWSCLRHVTLAQPWVNTLEPPSNLDQDRLKAWIQIETLQTRRCRHPFIKCLLIILGPNADFGLLAVSETRELLREFHTVRQGMERPQPRIRGLVSADRLARGQNERSIKIRGRLAIPTNRGLDIAVAVRKCPAQVHLRGI